MNRESQLPLWQWCTTCGRPLPPDLSDPRRPLVQEHPACAWATLRWHPDVPAEIYDYARQAML